MVVSKVRGRIPVVLGVGGNCTRSVVEKLKHMIISTGSMPSFPLFPYYNKPSREGIYQHYKAISESNRFTHHTFTTFRDVPV